MTYDAIAGPRLLGRDGWATMAYDAMPGPLRRDAWAEIAGPQCLGQDGLRRDGWTIMT